MTPLHKPRSLLLAVSAGLACCSPSLQPRASAEETTRPAPPDRLFTGGTSFAESQMWQAAHARRTRKEGPAALLAFISRFPHSTYCDDALYWLGYSYSRQKLYPEAMAAWQKCWETYPQSTWADNAVWSWASQAYANRDYAAAIEAYQHFANRFPGNPLADDALYNITSYSRYLKDKQQKKAVARAAYEALAATYPSSDLYGSALYQVTRGLYTDGDYESCVSLCRMFLETQPCHDYADEMQYQIVMCYYGAKLYDQALAEIEKLKALFPGSSYIDTVARYEETMRMSQMRAASVFDPEAELDYRDSRRGRRSRRRRARRLYPPRVAGESWMPQEEEVTARDLSDAATSALNARAWDRALLLYQLVLDHFRGDTYWDDALYKMATVYDRAGDKVRAAAIYRRVYTEMIGSDYQDDALYYLAQLYEQEGAPLHAIRVHHEIVEQTPFSRWAETSLKKLTKHYFDTRDVKGLLAVYNLIITRFPGHDMWAEAAFQTGCIQMMYREYTEARDAFRLLLERCPTSDYAVRAQYLLAECHRRRGELAVSRDKFQDLLKAWPLSGLTDDVEARLRLIAKAESLRNSNNRANGTAPNKDEQKTQAPPTTPDNGAKKTAGTPPTPAPTERPGQPAPPPTTDAKTTEAPPTPDATGKLTDDEPEQPAEANLGPTEWKECKKDILEQFPAGLRGMADSTAPNSRNPLHVLFTVHRPTRLALNIKWCSLASASFAVNLFFNGKVVGTAWPHTGDPMIVEIPRWMVRKGRNHLLLYAPIDTGYWDYFALVGDGLAPEVQPGEREPAAKPDKEAANADANGETAAEEAEPEEPAMTEEERIQAWLAALQDPFSELWEGRRLTVGKSDRRYTEFSRANPGNFTEWWVDLDNNRYGGDPNTVYVAMMDSLTKEPEKATLWMDLARKNFVAGKYADAAPIFAGMASGKKLPPEIRKRGREMSRVTQEFVKRPTLEAISTEHFHLLAPLETSVILRQYDIPQLWEAAYALLTEWIGDQPYGGDRLIVVYDPDYSSSRGGNPIRLSTRYAQDPPQWAPMFSTLAQGYFYTPAVYASLARNSHLTSALSTFVSWRLPEVLIPDYLPAANAKTVAAAKSKYMTDCDLYMGQVMQGTSDFKRFNTNVAAGLLLKLAAMTGKPQTATDNSWPIWGEFCQLAKTEAAPLLALKAPEEQWAVFAHVATKAFGENTPEVLKRCAVPLTDEAQAAVEKALAEAAQPAKVEKAKPAAKEPAEDKAK